MMENSMIPLYKREYPTPAEMAMIGDDVTTNVMNEARKEWGESVPQIGDLVVVKRLIGYVTLCCHREHERRVEFVGQICEVGVQLVTDEHNPMCERCPYCEDHHHTVENVFIYGVHRAGEAQDGGFMVGLHEIRPAGANWGLDDINLDPRATVDLIE